MSDEPEPPALRLRPRHKPKADEASAAEAGASTGGADGLKLRPKPKLSLPSDGPEPADVRPPSMEAPAEAPAARPKPRLSLKLETTESPPPVPNPPAPPPPPPPPPPAAPADGPAAQSRKPRLSFQRSGGAASPTGDAEVDAPAEAPKINLPPAPPAKPKLKLSWANKEESPDGAPPPPPPPPRPPVSVELDDEPKPISMSRPPIPVPNVPIPDLAPPGDGPLEPPPVVTSIDGLTLNAPQYPPPGATDAGGGRGVPDDDDDEADEGELPRGRRKRPEQTMLFKAAVGFVAVLLIGLIGGGAYFGYQAFVATPEMPVVEPPVRPAAPVPRPVTTAPQSVPGQLVDKARQAAAGHDEVTDQANAATEAVAGEQAAPARPAKAPLPTLIIEDVPGSTDPVQIEPGLEFRTWVSDARISGVREGSEPRAFINGILVRPGDVLQIEQGIVFEGVDAARNRVIFKDATGAIVAKKY